MPDERLYAVMSAIVLETLLKRTKTIYLVTRLRRPLGGRLVTVYAMAGLRRRLRLRPVSLHVARLAGLPYVEGQRAVQLPEGRDAAWIAKEVGEKTGLGDRLRVVEL